MFPIITGVEPKSPAAHHGILAGDRLVSINGNDICDVLDYMYYSSDSRLSLIIEQKSGKKRSIVILKDEAQPLGLLFESYLMDKPRSCANSCIFCFIDQLPSGLRDTLYFKDDDARLSFLMGNYITLTNLTDREIQRIIDLRISPINISVHTTDPELRVSMLRNKRAAKGLDIMRRFAEARIVMNCQIVCCPGINDGQQLKRTMEDLSALFPAVSSVSVVPVGITKYRENLYPLSACGFESASDILDLVDDYGEACLKKYGSRIFFCSDELYLTAKRPIPSDTYYEGYPQYENGVGMLRLLEDEFLSALSDFEAPVPPLFSIATGMAAAPLLRFLTQEVRKRFPDFQCNIYAIENKFLGSTVSVAGLLSGSDLLEQLQGKELGARLLLPSVMLRHGGDLFLDSMSLDELSSSLNVPIKLSTNDGFQLLDLMFEI